VKPNQTFFKKSLKSPPQKKMFTCGASYCTPPWSNPGYGPVQGYRCKSGHWPLGIEGQLDFFGIKIEETEMQFLKER